jgi:hypothetical protein
VVVSQSLPKGTHVTSNNKEPTYIPNHLVVYQTVIQNVPEQNICEICDMKYYIASSMLALLY